MYFFVKQGVYVNKLALFCKISLTTAWGLAYIANNSVMANPQGGSISFGVGDIDTSDQQNIIINQTSSRLAIDWDSFSISAGESVTFSQPGASAIALNRDFSGSPSEIFGDLIANGHVFLLNTAGVVIGSTGFVDTGGLLISDMTTTVADFASGDFTLQAAQRGGITIEDGAVINGGSNVQLVAGFIDNAGRLTSSGNLGLAVADSAVVSMGSSGLLGVAVSAPLNQAPTGRNNLINNQASGEIIVTGGDVIVQARYFSDLAVSAVNNEGLVNALAIADEGGRIFLTDTPVPRAALTNPGNNPLAESGEESVNALEEPVDTSMEDIFRLDQLVADCVPDITQGVDCTREDAIKRYLGRLLINGRLE
ncbi:MAG: filamentous hemagglutinin N-terminal domain-containing protein [Halomonadaceae bacterium]|nr:MAG: filamentous hemagglutinin N-terminal domain-containing protein [Halomonadaceae bacterium]